MELLSLLPEVTFRLVVDCCSFVVVVRAVVVAFDVEMVAYLALDHVDSSYLLEWNLIIGFMDSIVNVDDKILLVPGFMPGTFFDIG